MFKCAERLNSVALAAMLSMVATAALSQMPNRNSQGTLPDPNSVQMASSGVSENLGTISFYQCANDNGAIACYFTANKAGQGRGTYFLNQEWGDLVSLYDNFNVEHKVVNAYWVNGRNQRSESISLAQGDTIWFVVNFGKAGNDITGVKLSLPKYASNGYRAGSIEFRGQMVQDRAVAVTPALAQRSNSQGMLPDPNSVQMASSGFSENLGTISFYQCANDNGAIACYFTANKAGQGRGTYFLNQEWRNLVSLYDNFNVEHKVVTAYWVNGKNQRSETISLAQGDTIWFVVNFGKAEGDITSVKLSLPKYASNGYRAGSIEFRGKMVQDR